MERSPFLPLPEGMVIGQVEMTQTQLTVEVISTQPSARCPGCGNLSEAVHCQYQRTVPNLAKTLVTNRETIPCNKNGVLR
jgi:hypothetical protein